MASRPWSLVHLAEFLPHVPGNFVAHLEVLALRARARGWDCFLGLPVSDTPRGWHQRLVAVGWRLHLLRRPWGLRPRFVRDLRTLVAEARPHIVHLHFHAPSLVPVTLLTSTRFCVRIMHWHSPPRAPLVALRALDLWARPQHITVYGALAAGLGLPTERVHALRNGVVFPSVEPSPPVGVDLLAVSAFRSPKDPSTLLRAVASIARDGWTGRLRWAGTGPLLEGAQREAAELGILSRIDFLGDVDDPAPLFASCALLIHSSLREGQPYVVLEAIAHGRPVVATDLPGIREILGPDAESLCAPAGDPAAMAERVRSLLGDRGRAGEITDRLRAGAREKHSIETWAATLLDWYEGWTAR